MENPILKIRNWPSLVAMPADMALSTREAKDYFMRCRNLKADTSSFSHRLKKIAAVTTLQRLHPSPITLNPYRERQKNATMTRDNHYMTFIFRNVCLIAGFYLALGDQMELTTSRTVGFILLIIGFNTWMISNHKKNDAASENT